MNELKRIPLPDEYIDPTAFMKAFDVDFNTALNMVMSMLEETFYSNDVYRVNISAPSPESIPWPQHYHISIIRHDKQPIHNWADFQQIKNQLVGPENEGIEIYPAESRLVDMAPQYHLWVFADPTVRIPTGYNYRMVRGENKV